MNEDLEGYVFFRFINFLYYSTLILSISSVIAATLIPFFREGDWSSLLWLIVAILIIYAILNIIRESLIYIIYGRKFTWDWAKKIFKYISSH